MTMEINVLELCNVSLPPTSSMARTSLPLTFLDTKWINFQMKFVFFYDLPQPKTNITYFTQTLVPSLKHSLSHTLNYFHPLAGKLIVPASSGKPEIRCSHDDVVSLTLAECSNHDMYNHLTGNYHARDEDELFLLVPKLLSLDDGCTNDHLPDCLLPQLIALQVTLFPGHGISIGISNHHCVGDANTLVSFLRMWCFMSTKVGGNDDGLVSSSLLPFYERSILKTPKGVKDTYTNIVYNKKQEEEKMLSNLSPPPSKTYKKVRSTFTMSQADIQRLKNMVSARRSKLTHVSTYTVVCSHIWACIAKARKAIGMEIREGDMEHFIVSIDCRSRVDPPIPDTYFGNCIVGALASIKTTDLVKDDHGLVIAAETIGESIRAKLHTDGEEGGVFENEEKWSKIFQKVLMSGDRIFSITDLSKFGFYDINFGWGRPKKFEIVTSCSFTKCKDLEEGFEIGLRLPENEMDAFAAIFAVKI